VKLQGASMPTRRMPMSEETTERLRTFVMANHPLEPPPEPPTRLWSRLCRRPNPRPLPRLRATNDCEN